MKKRVILIVSIVLIAVILSFFWYRNADAPVVKDMQKISLYAPNGQQVVVNVEIADSNSERSQGLMNRTELAPGTGMLFVYDKPEVLSFWMKNTKIPLDILFFDNDGYFVSRTSMDPCISDPCATYFSLGPAQYALEVAQAEPLTRYVDKQWRLIRP